MNIEEIKTFIKDKKSDYELIASKRDIDREMQEKALQVVKEFISERNLILYGGIAIDYALRLKGSSIYSEDELPDYDCLSPNSVDAAYDLAELLHKKGFSKVNVIRAVHVQTMRVRVDFIVVADISYCPKEVFERLETLQYKELKILHPYFQRIDMHLSLSFPFMGAPNVTIFHRWKKDIKRLNLFEEHYPINTTVNAATIQQKIKNVEIELPEHVIQTTALHGQAGYGVLRKALEYTITEMKLQKDISHIPDLKIKLEKVPSSNRIKIIYESTETNFTLISSDPEKTIEEIEEIKEIKEINKSYTSPTRYNSLMEFRPEYVSLGDLQIYSIEDQLLSISIVNIDGIDLKIPSSQYLLIYFMNNALFAKDDSIKQMNLFFYNAISNMIKAANDIFKEVKDPKLISNCPFFLPLQFLGSKNEHQSYKIAKIDSRIKLKIATEEEQALFRALPKKGYYLDKDIRPKSFDYNHPWFLRDGDVKK